MNKIQRRKIGKENGQDVNEGKNTRIPCGKILRNILLFFVILK